MSADTEDAVFAEEPTKIKISGSGNIAALINKKQKTGQLKDISKKDRLKATSPGRQQRIQSVPDQTTSPTKRSKATYRSVSVSPSTRQVKVSSVVLTRGKSPTPDVSEVTTSDLSDQISPTSQSSGISSLEDTPAFDDTAQNQSTDSPKPVPKPRLVKRSTVGDVPPVTQTPQVEDLKNENQSLKQEISHLKEQQSELKKENTTLRNHLQSSDEHDAPSESPKSRHKFESSKPIPIPRSSTDSSSNPRQQVRRASEQIIKPETPQSPVPKPRFGSKPSTSTSQEDEKAKAVKTLQALLPVGSTPKLEGSSPREARGADGLTRTERSLLQLQELMQDDDDDEPEQATPAKDSSTPAKPAPKARIFSIPQEEESTMVESQAEVQASSEKKSSAVSGAVRSWGNKSSGETSSSKTRPSPPKETKKETSVTRPSPPRETKKETSVTRPSPPRETKKETNVPIPSPSKQTKKEVSVTKSSPLKETKPSPLKETKKETSVTRPSPPQQTSSPTKEASSVSEPKESDVTRPPPAKEATTNVPRPSATQGAPSSASVTTTSDTKTRDPQTPKEPTKSSAPPTRPPPPKSVQKRTQIKSDASWIKRKDSVESYDSHSTISASQTMPDLTPSPSPTPARKHQPYRSHAIISTSTPNSSSSHLPATVKSDPDPHPTTEPKPPLTPEPKISRERAGKEKSSPEEQRQKKKRSFSFTRSTSDDKIASKLDKQTEENKTQPPPKKPPRLRMLKTSSDSKPASRPASMMVANSEYGEKVQDRGLTASTSAGTMPRTPPQDRRGRSETTYKPGKKGLFSRLRNKTQYKADAPPLQEEPDEETESSSDDEQGGTIKRMPKLRHVSVRAKSIDIDDNEPEYHQLFEYVFVVGLKEKAKGELDTEITYTFPPAPEHVFSGKDAAPMSVPQFCFPDIDQWKPVKSYKSESFSFVLTDIMGGRRYGYCRRLLPSGKAPRLPEVFCIISPLGCFSLYEKILDHVEERRAVSSLAVFNFLKAIQANPFPRPGRSVEVRAISARGTGLETTILTRPLDSRLEHVDFSLLFSTLSPRKIIQLFSSVLMERRVILSAHSLSLLSGCAHALLALLYPFEWQHVFIPVLPSSVIDFVCSPLPYIIGINPSNIKLLDDMEMEEALVIDLEKKKFAMKIGDEASILPTKLFQYLEHSLGSSIVSSAYSKKSANTDRADEIVVNTFMTFFAYLYGDYKRHMKVTSSGEKEFQREQFVKTFSSKSTRRFLGAFHMTQMFENFIEQRENPAKEATTAQSHFEQQLSVLQPRCKEIEIFSSKSRFDRWKLAKGIKKK